MVQGLKNRVWALIVLFSFMLLIQPSVVLCQDSPGDEDIPSHDTIELLNLPSNTVVTNTNGTGNSSTGNTGSSTTGDTSSTTIPVENKDYKRFQNIPDDLTTEEYVTRYLEMAEGDADKAWDMAYADRYQEGFQNLQRRDAEHYLWSKADVDKNSYQWLPSMIRTTGYSVMKVGQYWGIEGINKVRTMTGKNEIDNTTRPTMDEFVWGIRGSQDSLFGTGN